MARAATVAASSFDMKITDPKELLDAISHERLQDIFLSHRDAAVLEPKKTSKSFSYVEPGIAEKKSETSSKKSQIT